MVRLDRLCCWIFIISFILLIPSNQILKYADELMSVLFLGVALIDCVLNLNWKRYNLLWLLVAIFSAYAIYSIVCFNFNTPKYILKDLIIELKPFLPFIVIFAVTPSFTDKDKAILKIVAVFNVVVAALILLSRYVIGYVILTPVLHHVMNAGTTIFVSTMVYLYCSIDRNGCINKRDLVAIILFLISGLMCTRSKYYGEFVLAIFFIFIYRPGILKNFNIKHAVLIMSVIAIFIGVGWSKFEFYFIKGSSDIFDPNVVASFARPVLYVTSGFILCDYFPFGTGLASFASFPSAENYSNLYYEYHLDKIWGLSPTMPDFICDAYYPLLAQFGIVGVILFIYYWIYIYRYIKILLRSDNTLYKYTFCTGVLLICFLLIESIASTVITQNCGMMAMMLLGMICAKGKEIMEQIDEEKLIDNGKI